MSAYGTTMLGAAQHAGTSITQYTMPKRDTYTSHTDRHTFELAVPATWTIEADCLGDPAPYDQDKGKAEDAAQLCAGCPVLEQCLSAAMDEEGTLGAMNRYGIRGGLFPKQRAELAMSRRGQVA